MILTEHLGGRGASNSNEVEWSCLPSSGAPRGWEVRGGGGEERAAQDEGGQ